MAPTAPKGRRDSPIEISSSPEPKHKPPKKKTRKPSIQNGTRRGSRVAENGAIKKPSQPAPAPSANRVAVVAAGFAQSTLEHIPLNDPARQAPPSISKIPTGPRLLPPKAMQFASAVRDSLIHTVPAPAFNSDPLPFYIEHAALCMVQDLVEEALFYWAAQWLPELLREKQWVVPAAGELNAWCGALQKKKVPHHALDPASGITLGDLRSLLTRLHQVRHAAVHRLKDGSPKLRAGMPDAIALTACLRDEPRNRKLRELHAALGAYPEGVEQLEEILEVKRPPDILGGMSILTIQHSVPSQKPQQQMGHSQLLSTDLARGHLSASHRPYPQKSPSEEAAVSLRSPQINSQAVVSNQGGMAMDLSGNNLGHPVSSVPPAWAARQTNPALGGAQGEVNGAVGSIPLQWKASQNGLGAQGGVAEEAMSQVQSPRMAHPAGARFPDDGTRSNRLQTQPELRNKLPGEFIDLTDDNNDTEHQNPTVFAHQRQHINKGSKKPSSSTTSVIDLTQSDDEDEKSEIVVTYPEEEYDEEDDEEVKPPINHPDEDKYPEAIEKPEAEEYEYDNEEVKPVGNQPEDPKTPLGTMNWFPWKSNT